MSVSYNGTNVDTMTFNGNNVETWTHNGVEVFSAGYKYIFDYTKSPTWNPKITKTSDYSTSNSALYWNCSYQGSSALNPIQATATFTIKKTSRLKRITAYAKVNASSSTDGSSSVRFELYDSGELLTRAKVEGMGTNPWGGSNHPFNWTGTLTLDVSSLPNGTYTFVAHSILYDHDYNANASVTIYNIMPVYQ